MQYYSLITANKAEIMQTQCFNALLTLQNLYMFNLNVPSAIYNNFYRKYKQISR